MNNDDWPQIESEKPWGIQQKQSIAALIAAIYRFRRSDFVLGILLMEDFLEGNYTLLPYALEQVKI